MTRLDALPPDDSTPETDRWEEWAIKLKVGDRAEVTEGGYAGHRGRVEALDDDTVQLVFAGDAAAQTFHWHEIGPVGGPRMRPTLWLTNLSSKKWHGSGRKVCAMARPRHFEKGDGRCSRLAPMAADLLAIKAGSMGLAEYRRRFEDRLRPESAEDHNLAPGVLRFDFDDNEEEGDAYVSRIRDGDTVFCSCARPGSKSRRTPCHLEAAVPFLVRAGWDVRLDGRLVAFDGCDCNRGPPRHDGDPECPCRGRVRWMEGRPGPYRAEDFGWPEPT